METLQQLRAQVLDMAFNLGVPFPPVASLNEAQLKVWQVRLQKGLRDRAGEPGPGAMVEA